MTKNILIALIALIIIGVGGYFFLQKSSDTSYEKEEVAPEIVTDEADTDTTASDDTLSQEETKQMEGKSVIGSSVEDNDIVVHHFGTGDNEVLFVGGIHGGYSWNTTLVAYELIDYLESNPGAVPENVRVTVIPVLNPDGLGKVVETTGRFSKADVALTGDATIPGRFNANDVDLNRNFDCDWQAQGVWQSRSVSGGAGAFSEPESQALRDYVTENTPTAVVAYYSAAGGVFASNCHNGVSEETTAITNAYADASGYQAYEEFDFYEITGDMVNWFAKNNVPAISVLLTTHESVEWEKNKAGIEAILEYYSE